MEERLTHLYGHNPLFSHDGIYDSQTHLVAPPFFYEQLRREVALSLRTEHSFSLVKIVFDKRPSGIETQPIRAEDILHFSCELRSLTRGSECIGRLGINECVILVSEGENAAQRLISRLYSTPSLLVNHTLQISLSMVSSLPGEGGLEMLNRLDRAALSTP